MVLVGVKVRQTCSKCNKVVGFAEAVHHNQQTYHQNCYRCSSCNKKLERGAGLVHQDNLFCHNCHKKAVGPMVFRKRTANIVNKRETLRKVALPRQPRFAHTSVDITENPRAKKALAKRAQAAKEAAKTLGSKAEAVAKRAKKSLTPKSKESRSPATKVEKEVDTASSVGSKEKLHHLEVAIFQGTSVDELRDYLNLGGTDPKAWPKNALGDLLIDIKKGDVELGYDNDGNALQTTSIVKIFMYDAEDDSLLLTPFCSYSATSNKAVKAPADSSSAAKDAAWGDMLVNVYPQVLSSLRYEQDITLGVMEDNMYTGLVDFLGFSNSTGLAVSGTEFELDENFVPYQVFTLKETPLQAAARALGTRFGLRNATPRMFNSKVIMKTIAEQSTRYPGLKMEIHEYHVMLKPQLIKPLQKSMPKLAATPHAMEEATESGKNTVWYFWLKRDKAGLRASFEDSCAKHPEMQKLLKSTPLDSVFFQLFAKTVREETVSVHHWEPRKSVIDKFL